MQLRTIKHVAALAVALLVFCVSTGHAATQDTTCAVEFVILGIGQDGGAPQIDQQGDPAWQKPQDRLYAVSGALVDHRSGERFLFEATPDIREQLFALHEGVGVATNNHPLGLAGVFLTHAHIGHYAGLMFAGHESAGTQNLNVYAMPRMQEYLSTNGPWDQLLRYNNIKLQSLRDDTAVSIGDDLSVTPYLVPHRDEYSETVGFVINGPAKSVLFLPDLDDWDRWEKEYGRRIEDVIGLVDYAYLDATFFDDNELPGRDMSKIPHPRLLTSMQRFSRLDASDQQKVRFFHINHTNQVRFSDSPQSQIVSKMGFKIAQQNERICLN